jgi:hypothetical protein
MENQLAYFGALLVRGSSKELLGWTAQDLQHAMRWAEYWERVVHGMTAAGDATMTLENAVDRLHVKFPALRLSVGDLGCVRYPESHRAIRPIAVCSSHPGVCNSICMQARCTLLRSLVNNLLVGRSMSAVAAVATAHMLPGSPDGTDAAAMLTQGVTARVNADAATAAVMRMVLVASQSQSAHSLHKDDKSTLDDSKSRLSTSLPETNAQSAFASYRTSPSCVVKLASARCDHLSDSLHYGVRSRSDA